MWELYHKEGWVLKNWCFRTVALEKTLESLLDSKKIKPVNPKGNHLLEGLMLMLKLKLQYFGHLMRRTNSLEKTQMLGKIEGRRRREWQDEMVGWYHWLTVHEFEQALRDGEEKGSLACSIHGVSKSWTDWVTEQQQCQLHLNLTKVTWFCFLVPKYKKEYSWLID